MASDDIARLVYLGLLVTVLVSGFLLHNRSSLSKTLQQAGAWVLIFLGAIAGVGLWEDVRQTVMPTQAVFAGQGRIEVPRSADGHYYLSLVINDATVRFVIDTGATNIVLTKDDARRIGLDVDDLAYVRRAMTANGEVRTAPVWLETVALGSIVDTDVQASVNGGELAESLLGMTYLQRWSRIEIEQGQLVLTR